MQAHISEQQETIAITYGFVHNDPMRWQYLKDTVVDEVIFESSLLVSSHVTPYQVQRRLSDWVAEEKVIQLRRGIYALPNCNPHPFVVANHLVKGSYISLQMALSYYHLIPEHVALVTSVTTQRPQKFENTFGRFSFRHIHPDLFFGISRLLLVNGEYAYIATPEKALLDLIHLRPQGDSKAYIDSLRLQNLDTLNLNRLDQFAQRSGKPKFLRAAVVIAEIAQQEAVEYEPL